MNSLLSRLSAVLVVATTIFALPLLLRAAEGSRDAAYDEAAEKHKEELAEQAAIQPAPLIEKVDYNRDIRPILSVQCYKCHGPDGKQRQADLRLDTREGALSKANGDPAIVPGKPAESQLVARITSTDPDEKMPPPKAGTLTAEQIKLLTDWIEQGADYSEHWAFVPPRKPPLPQIKDDQWAKSAIDRFVLQQLEQQGFKPARPATREALIRRASLDVTGLPPTPEEVKAFVADKSPDAYERLIDRLLQSNHYGERYGRHWLDVARYADSGGFETDLFFGHAWRFRDYVIRSINADKSYDVFVREQIAADELYPDNKEALLATGFFTTGPVLQEAGMVPGKLEYDQLTDAVDTTGSAFLGMTLGCARCHDHKYDPILQKEYYGLQAIFAASDQYDLKADGSILRGRAALKSTLKEFEDAQAKLRTHLSAASAAKLAAAKAAAAKASASDAAAADDEETDKLEYSELPTRVLAHREKPLDVHVMKHGELDDPGDLVEPGFPKKLARETAYGNVEASQRRAALANWIASPQNPLTARVIVNRVWLWHFGQALVRTPNDFGIRGEHPTHPELLDWLATEFVEHGWSLKYLHRLILLSNTYQMSDVADHDTLARDPENRLLTRYQPRRLEAEAIWDSLRAVAGTLDGTMYGLPFAPPLDDQEQIGNFRKWPTSAPEESNRRAVYILVKRSFRFPTLSAFDLPDNISSCGCRDITTVPNQALTMLNNRTVKEQAAAFAERLLKETDGDPATMAKLAWEYAYGREITDGEQQKVVEFIHARTSESAGDMKSVLAELCLALFNTNEFTYLP